MELDINTIKPRTNAKREVTVVFMLGMSEEFFIHKSPIFPLRTLFP